MRQKALENGCCVLMCTTGYFGIHFLRERHDIITIRGNSMNPTLKDGDMVYVRKICRDTLPFTHTKLEHGDIVYFRNPTKPNQIDVKRIIGVQKDVVTPVKNTLKADKEPVPARIKQGYVFLEADNMYQYYRQEDSNRFGQVPAGLILGIVKSRIFNADWSLDYKDFTEDRAIPKERVQVHEWKQERLDFLKELSHDDMLQPGAVHGQEKSGD